MLTGKRILITGGAGLVGSTAAKHFVKAGAHVTVLDSFLSVGGANWCNLESIKDKIEVHIGDTRDANLVEKLVQNKDCIFNLAAQTGHTVSIEDPFLDASINAGAQLVLLEALRKLQTKPHVLYASTRQLYGKPQYLPVDEAHPISPVDINGINKFSGEWYHVLYYRLHGIPTSVFRLTNTYGPGMRVKDAKQMFVGYWIRRLIENKPVQVFGDGKQIRDFNHAQDVVEAMESCLGNPKTYGEIYNLGSSEIINLEDLAKRMVSINQSGSYEIVPFPAERKNIDIGDFYGSFQKLTQHTGWKPKMPLDAGLKSTLEYYKEFYRRYWEDAV